jgi:exopolyphosphatase / guanosine-5'-triphosphate,3'-diphosphate pyrophosphatase
VNDTDKRAIIDIGSNSIRLVVYGGAPRAPITVYNEKFTAGLGRGVLAAGTLDPAASDAAITALARFAALVKLMAPASLQVAATAAVRDAANGGDFIDRVAALGLPVKLLSGDEEAVTSGYGVIAALPGADGIVVDLGGGSMELVRISGGTVHEYISLPLGILRAAELAAKGPHKLARFIQKFVSQIPWLWRANDLPLYLVGGSWRALARLHLAITGASLPVIGNHIIPRGDAAILADRARKMDRAQLRAIPSMPSSRVELVADSAALLASLVEIISPSQMIVCAFGLREGLLFRSLTAQQQAEDPLIAGARFAAQQSGRFTGYGDALAQWLAGLFPGEKPELLRLRHAACLIGDLSWSSNPEFRALSGEELALHGNWVGVTAADRAILATTLYASFGGRGTELTGFVKLIEPHIAQRAVIWGLAIRLAHRLSGGAPAVLEQTQIKVSGNKIHLEIPVHLSALDTLPVRGRLARLAEAMKLDFTP